jgi:hypothetical protein
VCICRVAFRRARGRTPRRGRAVVETIYICSSLYRVGLFGSGTAAVQEPRTCHQLHSLLRTYAAWEAQDFPSLGPSRGGVPTLGAQHMFAFGMTAALPGVRDAAFVLVAYIFGLRERSAVSIDAVEVETAALSLTVTVRVLNGTPLRSARRLTYHRVSVDLPSPIDLLPRYQYLGGQAATPFSFARDAECCPRGSASCSGKGKSLV